MTMKPLEIFNGPPGGGPNPWKVVIILEELELPYKTTWISYADIKKEPYISLNPNGRLPSLKDGNTGVALFESGAIVEYLISTYDKDFRIRYGGEDMQMKWVCQSWLHFQMSTQGPMFGQNMWFTDFHEEANITSVLTRYGNESKRIVRVIESHLQKRDREHEDLWLVGDKCTYADLAFVPWDILLLTRLIPEIGVDVEKEFPFFYRWHSNVIQRPAVKKVIEIREHCLATMEDTAKGLLPQVRYTRQ